MCLVMGSTSESNNNNSYKLFYIIVSQPTFAIKKIFWVKRLYVKKVKNFIFEYLIIFVPPLKNVGSSYGKLRGIK